jgi:hypothetical protein
MKALLRFSLALALLSITLYAHADEPKSDSAWIDTNTVLISNSQSPDIARRDCETTMRILNIMTNDKIVFRTSCEPSYNPRCMYYYCYQLCTKVLVVPNGNKNKEVE